MCTGRVPRSSAQGRRVTEGGDLCDVLKEHATLSKALMIGKSKIPRQRPNGGVATAWAAWLDVGRSLRPIRPRWRVWKVRMGHETNYSIYYDIFN